MATITSPPILPNATEGVFYAQPLTAAAAATWTIVGNPGWLSVDPASGTLSGMPATAGTYAFNVTATDAAGPNNPQAFSLTVAAAAPPPPPPAAGRDILRKLVSGGTALEIGVDILIILGAFLPIALATKYPLLTAGFVLTLVADVLLIAYLLWRQPGAAGARPTVRHLRGGVFAAVLGTMLTILGLIVIWVPFGWTDFWVAFILVTIGVVTLVADIVAAVIAIR